MPLQQLDYGNPFETMMQGLGFGQQFMQNRRMNPLLLEEKQLANAFNAFKNQHEAERAKFYPEFVQAEMAKAQAEPREINARAGLYGSQSNEINKMLPGRINELNLKNQFYPGLTQADINYKNAMAQFGGNLGAGAREEKFLQNLIGTDNPNFSPEQVYEASNAIRQGKTTLADGTPIIFSPAAKDSLDRLTKYSTTSPIITQSVQGAQAEAEMPVFKKYIDKPIKYYGNTAFGFSPELIKDANNIKDDAAQTRVGEYMAAQQLLFDRAALSMKVNALPPGVTLANEVRELSYATVKGAYPMMSAKARQVASDIVQKALMEALEARRSVDIGAASARKQRNEKISEKVKEKERGSKENPIPLVLKNGVYVEA